MAWTPVSIDNGARLTEVFTAHDDDDEGGPRALGIWNLEDSRFTSNAPCTLRFLEAAKIAGSLRTYDVW